MTSKKSPPPSQPKDPMTRLLGLERVRVRLRTPNKSGSKKPGSKKPSVKMERIRMNYSFLAGGDEDRGDEENRELCSLALTLNEEETFDLIARLFNALKEHRFTNSDDTIVQVVLNGDIGWENTE